MAAPGGSSGAADSDAELYQRVLLFTGNNSRNGQKPVLREDYLRNMRKVFGIGNFQKIVEILGTLDRDGLVGIEYLGPTEFRVIMTPIGIEMMRRLNRGDSPASTPGPEPSTDPSRAAPPAVNVNPVTRLPTAEELSAIPDKEEETEEAPASEEAPPEGEEEAPEEPAPDMTEEEESPEGAEEEVPAETAEGEAGEEKPPITDVIASMQAKMSQVRRDGTPLPPQVQVSPQAADKATMAYRPGTGIGPEDIRQARENLDKRERVLRERSKGLAQREIDLNQREESFEETKRLMEEELGRAKVEYDRILAESRARFSKLEEREKQFDERERMLKARIGSLEDREKELVSHAQTLMQQEEAMEDLENQRSEARKALRQSHAQLGQHVKKNQGSRSS